MLAKKIQNLYFLKRKKKDLEWGGEVQPLHLLGLDAWCGIEHIPTTTKSVFFFTTLFPCMEG